jgi:hypothetical protein
LPWEEGAPALASASANEWEEVGNKQQELTTQQNKGNRRRSEQKTEKGIS